MEDSFTRSVNLAGYIIMTFETRGEEALLFELKSMAKFIVENNERDVKKVNIRMMNLVSGVLSELFPGDMNKVLRNQSRLTEEFISEPDMERKVEIFATKVTDFLKSYEEGTGEKMFSGRVIGRLKAMDLNEIRMLTVESLARTFSYSESRFSAKFKEETGYTIQNKIMDEKLNRAFKMLKSAKSKTTVESVASAVGYTDTVYFSRLFLKKHNIYPSDVLKRAKMSYWANQDRQTPD